MVQQVRHCYKVSNYYRIVSARVLLPPPSWWVWKDGVERSPKMLLRQSPGFMLPTVAQVCEDNFKACVSRMKKKKYSKAVGDTTMLHAGLAAEHREKTVRPCVRFAQLAGKRLASGTLKTSSLRTCQMLVLLCLKCRMGSFRSLSKNSESQGSSHASMNKCLSSKNH